MYYCGCSQRGYIPLSSYGIFTLWTQVGGLLRLLVALVTGLNAKLPRALSWDCCLQGDGHFLIHILATIPATSDFFFFLPVPCDFEQALHVLLHVVVLSEAKLQAGVFWSPTAALPFSPCYSFGCLIGNGYWLLLCWLRIQVWLKLPFMTQGLM